MVYKPFTYQDYQRLPSEPGCRYQVLNGQLVKDPSPGAPHQVVFGQLHLLLAPYFKKIDPLGMLFLAPMDVTFGETNVVQPDLFFVTGDKLNIIKGPRIEGAPALVVEIISPFSRRRDRIEKMQIYLLGGVKHYWLVDPEKESFDCFVRQEETYTLAAAGRRGDIVQHPDFPGLRVNLAELWISAGGFCRSK